MDFKRLQKNTIVTSFSEQNEYISLLQMNCSTILFVSRFIVMHSSICTTTWTLGESYQFEPKDISQFPFTYGMHGETLV